MTNKIKQLESLAVVQVDLSIWSGQTKLNPEDIKLGVGGSLPPERVAQLGSKKIIDTSRLKVFHAIRQTYRRLLHRVGMPFMNGYAVPISKLDQIIQFLDALESEFEVEKQVFLDEYDQAIDQWALENPEMEEAIRACSLSNKEVEKRINFDYQIFKITPLENDDVRINRKITGLGNELIAEIISEAKAFYLNNLLGKNSLNTRTRSTLIGWFEKLEGLAFLSNRIQPLADLIKAAIDSYQHAVGRNLTSPYLWQVVGAVLICSDESKVDQYLAGTISIETEGKQVEIENGTNLSLGSLEKEDSKDLDNTNFSLISLDFVDVESTEKVTPTPSDKEKNDNEQTELPSIDDFFSDSLQTEPKEITSDMSDDQVDQAPSWDFF